MNHDYYSEFNWIKTGVTNIEGKEEIKDANLSQLIGIAVVSSFTEFASNSMLNPMMPTIMIDHNCFLICLYDCVNDILMVSEKMLLCDDGKLDNASVSTLFAFLNHK